MGIKMEIGGYYKLSDGRVTGPATTWGNPDVAEHYFELPIESASGYKKTIFRADGTTDYAAFHVVERAAKPAFVCAGAYYKTADGVTVGPMVGPDRYGRFRSDGNELYAIRNDGVALLQYQQWEDSGVVLAENEYEKGHRLVERVPAIEAGSGEDPKPNETTCTLKVDLSEGSFIAAYRVTLDEFNNRLNEAQSEIAKRDAEIEALKASREFYRASRNELSDFLERAHNVKLRGDKRLRLARSRYKVARGNFDIVKVENDGLRLRIAELEKAEGSKKVKAVVDFIGGLFVLGAVAVATYLVAVA